MDRIHALLAAFEELYNAALDDAAWSAALSVVADVAGGQCGMLVDTSAPANPLVVSAGMSRESVSLILHELTHRCPTWIQAIPFARPTRQTSLISDEEFERSDLYQRCVRRTDGFYGMILPLASRSGTVNFCVVGRMRGQPDFTVTDVDRLAYAVPCLQAALAVRRRLHSHAVEVRFAYEAFAHAQIGVVLLDSNLRPLYLNTKAEAFAKLGDGLLVRNQSICASNPRESLDLLAAITLATLAGGPTHHAVRRQCRLTRRPPLPPLTVMSLPFNPDISGGPSTSRVMLMLTEDVASGTGQASWAMYRLSAREQSLAELLTGGLSLHEAGERLGLSRETARTYLKRIFAKTDTHRQSELVSLLLRT